MKLLRRLVTLFCGLLLILALGGIYLRHRAMKVPPWYHPFALDPQIQREAANDVDQMLIPAYSNALHVQDLVNHGANVASLPPISLQFTEDGLNSWAIKWDKEAHWRSRVANHIQDAIILFPDHQIILAALAKEWNVIASLHFEPRVAEGKLNLRLVKVMAGELEVPRWAWSRYVEKVADATQKQLPALQQDAEIDPRGRANAAAVSAAMSTLLLHVLHDQPGEPVVFLPESLGHGGRSIAMLITGVDISNKTLTLTIQPMTPDQRESFWQQLRGPEQGSIGAGK